MLRDFALADIVTLTNGFAGVSAVFAVLRYLETSSSAWLWVAMGALPVAVVADYFDGTIARWRRKVSLLGAQLDSLADLISFGVAPAVIGYACGMRGGWDALVLIYFVLCGLSRLARYNVTAAALSDDRGKVRYFEGTPIPTSVVLVLVLAVLEWRGLTGERLALGSVRLGPWLLHPLALMYALSGSAMISKTLRVPKP